MKSVGIPLILTFKLDDLSQRRLNIWRQRYFPKERNHLDAHLTIYHQLPGQRILAIKELLSALTTDDEEIPIHFDGLSHRAGFIAVTLESPQLFEMKTHLDGIFKDLLRAQDRQGYRPHVTISNLGSPAAAKRAYDQLSSEFEAWTGQARALDLYHYRKGPWEHAATFPLKTSPKNISNDT